MEPLLLQFQGFVTDLTSVEKRSIVALTEIARDALRTQPQLVPGLANIVATRIVQAPSNLKLPVLYLLDSIAKNIGEPYKAHFAASLPDIYTNAWVAGGPQLHRPLEKLLATWNGVFPPATLHSVRAHLAASTSAAAAPPLYGETNGYGTYPGYKPMMADPRLGGSHAQPYAQHPHPPYGGYVAGHQQPLAAAYAAPNHQLPAATVQQTSVIPDLFALISSGALAGGGGTRGARSALEKTLDSTGRMATRLAESTAAKGRPQTVQLSNDIIKKHNPAAVARLIAVTERTKSNFLDRKFIRRQNRSSGMGITRLWYVDLDTWMAGSTVVAVVSADGMPGGPAGPDFQEEDLNISVTADDDNTHCALSGEKFEQFWDEDHQEWRYRGAKKLTAEEAGMRGLEEGALVLASALHGAAPVSIGTETVPIEVKAEGTKIEADQGGVTGAEDVTGEGGEPAAKRIKME